MTYVHCKTLACRKILQTMDVSWSRSVITNRSSSTIIMINYFCTHVNMTLMNAIVEIRSLFPEDNSFQNANVEFFYSSTSRERCAQLFTYMLRTSFATIRHFPGKSNSMHYYFHARVYLYNQY